MEADLLPGEVSEVVVNQDSALRLLRQMGKEVLASSAVMTSVEWKDPGNFTPSPEHVIKGDQGRRYWSRALLDGVITGSIES